MKAPLRLVDDPTVDAQLRADLEIAAESEHSYDVAKGMAAMSAVLGDLNGATEKSAELVAKVSASGKTGAASSTALGGVKVTLAVAFSVAAVGLGALGLKHVLREAPPSRKSAPIVATATATAMASARPPAPTPSVSSEPAQPRAPKPALDGVPRAKTAVRATNQRSGFSASRREIEQFERIQEQLETSPGTAYRAIQEAEAEFPFGRLREEREGLRVIALWNLGQRKRARAQASRFLRRYPESPLRARIERLLAEDARR